MFKTGRTLLIGLLACAIGGGIAVTAEPQTATAAAADLPQILPAPQQETAGGVEFSLKGTVNVVVGEKTDAAAKTLLQQTIAAAGGTAKFVTAAPDAPAVYLGTASDNPAITGVLTDLKLDGTTDIKPEGYVLGSGTSKGQKALVLDGIDASGTYYAVQTLRQIVKDGVVPAVQVRDWPLMSIRGAIEGFYGIPWSHQARLDQLDFDGAHKLNTYIYTPKDDDYLRGKWREQYPAAELAQLKQLVETANANHVNFTFALSPGNDICYSSDADFAATTAKFDQLRALGVTSFYIALDDIPLELHCQSDKDKFTKGNWGWLADAQTYYLNKLVKQYIEPNNLQPLQTVPTNYAGSGPDPYKTEFGQTLDPSVRVQWTGEGVFSDAITLSSVQNAAKNYYTKHLYIWDNFPVNDGQRGRLFLNPLEKRDPQLYTVIDGITSNPMIEPYASMIALAGYADYTWNPLKYDAATTQAAIISELAGADPAVRDALDAFVDLNQNWKPYRPSSKDAPKLSADMDAFWTAYAAGDAAGMQPLQNRLAVIAALPTTLKGMAQPGFYADAKPWIDAASHWAAALKSEIASLTAIKAGQGEVATKSMLAAFGEQAAALAKTVPDLDGNGGVAQNVLVASVGDGTFQTFSDKAVAAYNAWLGATPVKAPPAYQATATSSMGTYSDNTVAKMTDGKLDTLYWSNAAPKVGDAVTVDLGSVKSVGTVTVHQSDSDTTTGDMLYHVDLQYSADGTSWTTASHYDSAPLISYTFPKAVDARYVRLVATATNPGDKWVKVREFQVGGAQTEVTTDVPAANGASGPLNAFDGTIATAFTAASAPAGGAYLTRTFDAPQHVGSVTLVGTSAGTLEYEDADGWHEIGPLDTTRVFQEGTVDKDGVTAVRVLFSGDAAAARVAGGKGASVAPAVVPLAAGSSVVPNIYEFVSRAGAPIAHDPLIGAGSGTPGGGGGTGNGGTGTGNGTGGTGTGTGTGGSGTGGSGLANTGSDLLPLGLLAVLLAVAGAGVLTLRKRRA